MKKKKKKIGSLFIFNLFFFQSVKKGILTLDKDDVKTRKIFKSLETFMNDQLRRVCLESLDDYMDLVIGNTKPIRFNVNVSLKNEKIVFEPSFKSLAQKFVSLLNLLPQSVNEHKKIDVELLPGLSKDEYLKVQKKNVHFFLIDLINFFFLNICHTISLKFPKNYCHREQIRLQI